MVSARRQLNKKMTFVANDEFWHAPIAQDAASTSDDGTAYTRQDSMEFYLPPAHHQLLAKNAQPSHENLKGYDHTRGVFSYNNFDDFDFEATDLDTSFGGRNSLSEVKQQGGGSWLLGFARMRDETSDTLEEDVAVPGLVRLESEDSSDDESTSTSTSTPTKSPQKSKGVSFSEAVTVQPIPHSSTLPPLQRRKMYTSTLEVRRNKIRNKREYRHDGCDWRNATEEWEMGVDVITGELVHPVHDQFCGDNVA